jgi:hypothetical protein
VIPSELKGNSKGDATAGISLESRGLYRKRRDAAPYRKRNYRSGLGSQLVEMMMRDDDSRGTFTRKRRPLSATW